MLSLVDTNILVYRFDARYPRKKAMATSLLRRGLAEDSIRIPHQAIVEFVAATTRAVAGSKPLLDPGEARREAEEMLLQLDVSYPNEAVIREAMRGAAAYQLPWFDAHLWAFAEHYGCGRLISEDFEHERMYGTVLIVNPFKE